MAYGTLSVMSWSSGKEMLTIFGYDHMEYLFLAWSTGVKRKFGTWSNGKEMSLKEQERSPICYQSHDIQSKTTPLPR